MYAGEKMHRKPCYKPYLKFFIGQIYYEEHI